MEIMLTKAIEVFRKIRTFFFFFVLPIATLFLILFILWKVSEWGGWALF